MNYSCDTWYKHIKDGSLVQIDYVHYTNEDTQEVEGFSIIWVHPDIDPEFEVCDFYYVTKSTFEEEYEEYKIEKSR